MSARACSTPSCTCRPIRSRSASRGLEKNSRRRRARYRVAALTLSSAECRLRTPTLRAARDVEIVAATAAQARGEEPVRATWRDLDSHPAVCPAGCCPNLRDPRPAVGERS